MDYKHHSTNKKSNNSCFFNKDWKTLDSWKRLYQHFTVATLRATSGLSSLPQPHCSWQKRTPVCCRQGKNYYQDSTPSAGRDSREKARFCKNLTSMPPPLSFCHQEEVRELSAPTQPDWGRFYCFALWLLWTKPNIFTSSLHLYLYTYSSANQSHSVYTYTHGT